MIHNRIYTAILWGISLGIIIFHMSPYISQGEHVNLLIHDNLDQVPLSIVNAWKATGDYFSHFTAPIDQLMNGIPRGAVIRDLRFSWLCYWVMPPFEAYRAIMLTGKLVALISMWLLLGSVSKVFKSRQFMEVRMGLALCFALLPHYPAGGLTIPMIPMAIWALFAFYRKQARSYHWVILFIYPFCSSMIAAPIFLIIIAAGVWFSMVARTMCVDKKVSMHAYFLVPLTVFTVINMISEYQIFAMTFFNVYTSHRVEMNIWNLSRYQVLDRIYEIILNGQYHVHTLQNPYIYLYLFMCFIWMEVVCGFSHRQFRMIKYRYRSFRSAQCAIFGSAIRAVVVLFHKKRPTYDVMWWLFLLCMLSIVLTSFLYGIAYLNMFHQLLEHTGPLKMINWSRFHWLHPVLWYLAFGFASAATILSNKKMKWLCLLFILIQATHIHFSSNQHVQEKRQSPTYSQFYAVEQFDDIKDYIGISPEEYRVASLGIHPSVALYNGLYCLDGYVVNYPLEYKHQFRKIISGELDKSDAIKKYFDLWGSRCYLFSDELGKNAAMQLKDVAKPVSNLSLNTTAFKEMGGRYILSACRINNAPSIGLHLLNTFDTPSSCWRIWLYEAQ